MATPTASNVSNAKPRAAGGIHSVDLGTTLPTDATTELPTEAVGLGYVSDEGLTNSIEIDTETATAWGGANVMTVRTSYSETFSWAFIETNADVMREVYGAGNVTDADGDLTVLHKGDDLPERGYIFEISMTGGRVKRIVVPHGKITDVDDVSYQDGEPISYGVTLSCTPDKDGVTVYEYIAHTTSNGGGSGN